MIEEASVNNPVQMQNGFTAYDDCSTISEFWPCKICVISFYMKCYQGKMMSATRLLKYIRAVARKSRSLWTPLSALKVETTQLYEYNNLYAPSISYNKKHAKWTVCTTLTLCRIPALMHFRGKETMCCGRKYSFYLRSIV
jgi:hypothetical protein